MTVLNSLFDYFAFIKLIQALTTDWPNSIIYCKCLLQTFVCEDANLTELKKELASDFIRLINHQPIINTR